MNSKEIPTPTGKKKWSNQAIVKILTNEKYVGNVILGKSYSEQFPSKKRHENKDTEQMYLAEHTHPAIIAMEIFLAVQEERKRRSNIVVDEFGKYHRAAQRYCMHKSKISNSSTQPEDGDE